jgi:antitoxin (DNA-binding transcriptional repressor) of toxin-antitoxin stability system
MSSTVALEAGALLPQLMERVAQGESITLTKEGVAIAMLVPAPAVGRPDVEATVQELLRFREEHRLNGETLRDILEESRPR